MPSPKPGHEKDAANKFQTRQLAFCHLSLTPGFSPVSGSSRDQAVLTALATRSDGGETVKTVPGRRHPDTRLKPGANENHAAHAKTKGRPSVIKSGGSSVSLGGAPTGCGFGHGCPQACSVLSKDPAKVERCRKAGCKPAASQRSQTAPPSPSFNHTGRPRIVILRVTRRRASGFFPPFHETTFAPSGIVLCGRTLAG
jgi:hypothetical protein